MFTNKIAVEKLITEIAQRHLLDVPKDISDVEIIAGTLRDLSNIARLARSLGVSDDQVGKLFDNGFEIGKARLS